MESIKLLPRHDVTKRTVSLCFHYSCPLLGCSQRTQEVTNSSRVKFTNKGKGICSTVDESFIMATNNENNTYYTAGNEEVAQVTPLTLRKLEKVSPFPTNAIVPSNRTK